MTSLQVRPSLQLQGFATLGETWMPGYRLKQFPASDTGAMRPAALDQCPATFLAQNRTHRGPAEAGSPRDSTDRDDIIDTLEVPIGTHDTLGCGFAISLARGIHHV